MTKNELRADLVTMAKDRDASGLNQGASGSLSMRGSDRMQITPSAVPYPTLTADMIAAMPHEEAHGSCEGPLKPLTEWRLHLA